MNNDEQELLKMVQHHKEQFIQDFNKNYEEQEATLSLILGGIEHAKFNNFDTATAVWSLSGLVNLISYDLKIIGRDIILAETDWQKKHYIRQMYLLIYESMDDFLEFLGKSLRNAIKTFPDADIHLQAVNFVSAKLNAFKKKYEVAFKIIRNATVAHREHDIIMQYQIINALNWYDATGILGEYDKIIRDLGQVCQQLMHRSAEELHRNGMTQKE